AQAYRDVQTVLAGIAEREQARADEHRALELARYDDWTLEATRILRATHPLVSGGKVLSGFTESGKPIGLTDDGPKLAAIDRLLRISESRRKLLGLDMQPGTLLPGNVEIILRWHGDSNRIIDVTPDGDHAAAFASLTDGRGDASGAVQGAS